MPAGVFGQTSAWTRCKRRLVLFPRYKGQRLRSSCCSHTFAQSLLIAGMGESQTDAEHGMLRGLAWRCGRDTTAPTASRCVPLRPALPETQRR